METSVVEEKSFAEYDIDLSKTKKAPQILC